MKFPSISFVCNPGLFVWGLDGVESRCEFRHGAQAIGSLLQTQLRAGNGLARTARAEVEWK